MIVAHPTKPSALSPVIRPSAPFSQGSIVCFDLNKYVPSTSIPASAARCQIALREPRLEVSLPYNPESRSSASARAISVLSNRGFSSFTSSMT